MSAPANTQRTFQPRGIMAAVVTPMHQDGSLDLDRLGAHIDRLTLAGLHGAMVIGGSGEYVNLSMEERKQVVTTAVQAASGRFPIIVGCLSPSTTEVLEIARHSANVGAGALLVLPPYYIRPSLPGVIEHYRVIAAETGLPIIAYNIPSRTGWNMDASALEAVAEVEAVVAVKDCERDVAALSGKIARLGSRLGLLSGDDDLGFATLLSGGSGGIWVTPNLAPKLCLDLYHACAEGRVADALTLHNCLRPFVDSWLIANHPSPFKTAMALAGHAVGPARMPLQPPTEAERAAIQHALDTYGPFA